jgi:hypothetical protein
MVRVLGVMASVIAGKPVGTGDHGSHAGLSSATPHAGSAG